MGVNLVSPEALDGPAYSMDQIVSQAVSLHTYARQIANGVGRVKTLRQRLLDAGSYLAMERWTLMDAECDVLRTLKALGSAAFTAFTPNLGLEFSPLYDEGLNSFTVDANDGGSPARSRVLALCDGVESVFGGLAAGNTVVFSDCTESEYNGTEYEIQSVAASGQIIVLTTVIGAVDATGQTRMVIRQMNS